MHDSHPLWNCHDRPFRRGLLVVWGRPPTPSVLSSAPSTLMIRSALLRVRHFSEREVLLRRDGMVHGWSARLGSLSTDPWICVVRDSLPLSHTTVRMDHANPHAPDQSSHSTLPGTRAHDHEKGRGRDAWPPSELEKSEKTPIPLWWWLFR
jgi:hypothetical protein